MLELHTTPTANGYKVSIMLEELGLPYRAHDYDLTRGDHRTPAYLALNPIGRLPTLVDDQLRDPGSGQPLSVYGTAAILLYLADKTGRLLPTDALSRARAYQWLGIVSSDIAPAYTGQFVFNVLAPEKIPWAIEHYDKLCLRLLAPMEAELGRSPYLAGAEYSIADVIAYPVAAMSMKRHPGSLEGYPNMSRWAAEIGARPAVQRGMKVPR
jgi:GST-like protein